MTDREPLHVIFGTGPLGLSTLHELRAAGLPVRMINRRGVAELPAGVEVRACDALNADAARAAAAGATVVYQCTNLPYERWATELPTLQDNILEAAVAAGARLVIADNLYMYGPSDAPLTEASPWDATTRKGRIRALMARSALAAHEAGRLPVSLARGSDFFGPHGLQAVLGERSILAALQGRTAQLFGDLDQPHTYTYIPDFGRTLAILGQRPEGDGQVWHVPNAETLTSRAIMRLFFEEMGLPPKMTGMGPLMLRVGGLFIPAARELVEMLYGFEQPFLVDGSKFERTFGLHPTPLRQAVAETVAWFRTYAATPARAGRRAA